MPGQGPERPALTEPLIFMEWREAPASVLWNAYNMLKSCSHLQYPFPSQLPPNLTAPIQPSLASSKPQSRSPSLSLENNTLPVLNLVLAFITKLIGICMPSES